MQKGNLKEKFSSFSEQWQPKIIAALNGQEVKIAKVQGMFPWHAHDATEEMFLVWKGRFRVEFRDKIIDMEPGDFVVVPRGTEHRTAAFEEAEIMIFETADTLNTGNVIDKKYTAPKGIKV